MNRNFLRRVPAGATVAVVRNGVREEKPLRGQIIAVLNALELLSEGKAAPIARSHGGKPESKPPAEAMLQSRLDRAPEKDRSLHDHYLWKFEHAEDERRFKQLLLAARKDLDEHLRGLPTSRRAGHMHLLSVYGTADANKIEAMMGDRIAKECIGIPDYEVAVQEECSVQFVRKVRIQRGQQPGTGKPKPEFLKLSPEDRRAKVESLVDAGMGEKRIAKRLGVSKQTVQRYYPGATQAA